MTDGTTSPQVSPQPTTSPPPSNHRPSTIERAYQLARSGSCGSVDDVRRSLVAEGHDSVLAHLSGPTIRRALAALCKSAVETR
ncbi:hypothetical protein [Sphingomonas oligophenolica]|uniref:Uncharacterized protein n=1 Tax=Sphingomonas oligophenolica TaxID=301154 RepID=A0A502CM15_9SPHN|nr:hypothetical protein [Sphingomonas oligophenolica]TPG13674.1 hypothetical protein EAH84_05720 [Sphingomonas oligophenolica]